MKYPEFLKEKGTIGFVAPSLGCSASPYSDTLDSAQQTFKGLGFSLDEGPDCRVDKGIGISNTPEKCAAEFMEYYCKTDNDCLISCGGGELMCEILDYLDFERLSCAKPKWFMGYSDNTNITYLLTTLCDTASIYGPCAGAFGMRPWHDAVKDAFDMLTGKKLSLRSYGLWEQESLKTPENPLVGYHVTQPTVMKAWPSDDLNFSGRLLGGCLDCLVNIAGTCFDKTARFTEKYKDDGILWFLESCDLNVFSIRRAMWELEHTGWFDHAAGFLIGRPGCYGQEMMGLDAGQAVLEVASRHNVPVVMDVDLGHLPPMLPIITGSIATVTVKGGELSIQMELR